MNFHDILLLLNFSCSLLNGNITPHPSFLTSSIYLIPPQNLVLQHRIRSPSSLTPTHSGTHLHLSTIITSPVSVRPSPAHLQKHTTIHHTTPPFTPTSKSQSLLPLLWPRKRISLHLLLLCLGRISGECEEICAYADFFCVDIKVACYAMEDIWWRVDLN